MTISDSTLAQMSCLDCGGSLIVAEDGDLACEQCERNYPLLQPGYFNFMLTALSAPLPSADTSKWDIHWETVKDLDAHVVSKEIDYFNEIVPAAFQEKIVLDVGCGSGRNLEKYVRERPRTVIMIDISDALMMAIYKWRRIKAQYPGVEVIFIKGDLHRLPFQRGQIPIVYTSCGVYNILPDQDVCIKEAMRFADCIFLLFNSPESVFGKIYYKLNPVRAAMQTIVPSKLYRACFARLISYVAYFFVKIFIAFFDQEVKKHFNRQALEFLINDWIFTSPQSTAHDTSYYQALGKSAFQCRIIEQAISRMVCYLRVKT